MIRSSFVAKGIGLGLIILGSIACGEKPPPKPPEAETTSPTSMTDGGETAAPTTTESHADAGAGGAAVTETPPPPAAPAKLDLPAAAAKLKFKAKKDYDLELKSDGTVNSGGKPAAKIMGMELQDPAGKTQLKVDADGTITTGDGGAYAKFEGDDLVSLVGAKYSIGDDGAIGSTDEKGKKTAMGKAEGVGSAKRAALLAVAFTMWGTKAPAPPPGKATAEKKPGEKPGAAEKKPAEKKPAEKKPAEKPKK
jgi:hypothetical protein